MLEKGFPLGTLDLQLDKEQNLWVSLMYQGGIAKFDRKTEKFQVYPVPKEWQGDHTQQSMVSPSNSHVDGKVWTNNQDTHAIYRLDIATGQYENLGEFQIPGAGRSINAYGIPSDSENNLYLLEFGANTSAASTRRPRSSKSSRRSPRDRARAAVDSTSRTVCGSPNTAPMASACSIRNQENPGMESAAAVERALPRRAR